MLIFPVRLRAAAQSQAAALILATLFIPVGSPRAQDGPIQPGEAYVTRFSGTRGAAIDVNGMVGSIIDLRSPGQPPQGQHWVAEPQRRAVTAGEVGQVFGVALDDASPPNVYIAATAAFGLHRTGNNQQWMAGMWGEGGPGAIYRLDAASGYTPRLFAQITLNGRPNSGAALGNLAYDRFNKQLFVSDLETGMIHRLRIADGADLGSFDHGTQGRPQFTDAEVGQPGSLPPIAFDPNSSARIGNCPSRFDRSPQCWNFAATGRRIWGLGVYRNPSNEVRLYYSVWSGPAFDLAAWNQQQEEDKRNSVWSVRLGPDGNFAGDVRREVIVPDFFSNPQDIARAGYSQPVSDIAFAACGPRPVMLLAERGGIRNLGLNAQNPFATPHEARALRYELDRDGAWRAIGRYDVGFYDRKNEGTPFMHANCSGGIAFGPGYDPNRWVADPSKPDQFVWISGDSLCSPDGPCNLPGAQQGAQAQSPGPAPGVQPAAAQGQDSPLDESEVHGLQGMAETAFEEVAPAGASEAPSQENATSPQGLNQAYLIDVDINVDPQGAMIEQELTRNDATKIGDVAVYQVCDTPAPASYASYLLAPPAAGAVGYHYRLGSHNRELSHFRYASHNPYWSHSRRESHQRRISHWRWASHDRRLSHRRLGSHERVRSHWRTGSHERRASHQRIGSHERRASHLRIGSHERRASHLRVGSHDRRASAGQKHNPRVSHTRTGSHNKRVSAGQKNGHNARVSHARTGSHSKAASQGARPKSAPKVIRQPPKQQLAPERDRGGPARGTGRGGHDPRSSGARR